jgi:hypothetical protein
MAQENEPATEEKVLPADFDEILSQEKEPTPVQTNQLVQHPEPKESLENYFETPTDQPPEDVHREQP